MLDLIFVSTLNIANIYHKNNGYFLGFQRNNRSFFFPPQKKQGLVWDSCRDGMRKTVAARGFVNGRGPPSGGRDSVFRCHPDNMVLSNKKKRVTPMPYGFWVTLSILYLIVLYLIKYHNFISLSF